MNSTVASRLLAFVTLLLVPLLSLAASSPGNTGRQAEPETMHIRITIGSSQLMATLEDNATAQAFAALLPLTLTLTDYHKTEKISDLPQTLTTAGAPKGMDPVVGDITYYAPWGNLAIFYRDFSYSGGLVKLGRVESGIELLRQSGPLKATIELVD